MQQINPDFVQCRMNRPDSRSTEMSLPRSRLNVLLYTRGCYDQCIPVHRKLLFRNLTTADTVQLTLKGCKPELKNMITLYTVSVLYTLGIQ